MGSPDPFAGVKPWMRRVVEEAGPVAYIALSQSGTSLRIIMEGKLPGTGRKKPVIRQGAEVGDVEMYDQTRFIALTDRTLHLGALASKHDGVRVVFRHFEFDKAHPSQRQKGSASTDGSGKSEASGSGAFDGETWSTGLSDDEVLTKARAMKHGKGDKFAKAFDGDLSEFHHNHSTADMYVLGVLAFFHGVDPEGIDRDFRMSGIYREKWDEKRGPCTYGELTIGNVLREKGGDRANYWSGRNSDGEADANASSACSASSADESHSCEPAPAP